MTGIAEQSETPVVELTPEEETAALAEFASGFTDDASSASVSTETPPMDTAEGDPSVAGTESTPAGTEAVAKEEESPLALTEEQIKQLIAAAQSIGDVQTAIGKLRDDAFGRMGGLERLIKTIQSQTPAGQAIEVTEEDLKEVSEEYEVLAPRLVKSLNRVLGKMKGTGSAVPSLTQEEIDQRIEKRAEEIATQRASAEGQRLYHDVIRTQLTIAHRDWQEVVGPKDSDTEFRRWLKLDPEKEKRALSSYDPIELIDVISEFKAQKKASTEKTKPPKPTLPVQRDQRLKEAVPVRGGGGKPPTPQPKTAEEEFSDGFASD